MKCSQIFWFSNSSCLPHPALFPKACGCGVSWPLSLGPTPLSGGNSSTIAFQARRARVTPGPNKPPPFLYLPLLLPFPEACRVPPLPRAPENGQKEIPSLTGGPDWAQRALPTQASRSATSTPGNFRIQSPHLRLNVESLDRTKSLSLLPGSQA